MKKYIIIILIVTGGIALFFGNKMMVKKKQFNSLMERIEEEVVLSRSVLHSEEIDEVSKLKPIQVFALIPEIDKKILLFREFEKKGEMLFLGADLETLKTFIMRQEDISYFEDYTEKGKETKLYKLLNSKTEIKNFSGNGYALMIELSQRNMKKYKFERDFFLFLATRKNPTPVSIIISSRWMIEDRESFNKIEALAEQKKLDVTWIVKSLNTSNLEDEILNTERLLLESGNIPSIFFKVSGVYDEVTAGKLKELSLIPIKENTILSKKGGKIKKGGIILVKGDGSDSSSIKKIIAESKKKKGLQIQSLYDNK